MEGTLPPRAGEAPRRCPESWKSSAQLAKTQKYESEQKRRNRALPANGIESELMAGYFSFSIHVAVGLQAEPAEP